MSQKVNEKWGKDTTNKRTMRFWFTKFRAGGFSLKDDPHCGQNAVIQEDMLRGIIEADPAKTTQ